MTQPEQQRVQRRQRRSLVRGFASRDTVKLREVPKADRYRGPPKGAVQHQGNDLGDGNNATDVTMDDPQPSPTSRTSSPPSSRRLIGGKRR